LPRPHRAGALRGPDYRAQPSGTHSCNDKMRWKIFEGVLNPDILIDFGAGRTAIR
jgi:hypothetical protein